MTIQRWCAALVLAMGLSAAHGQVAGGVIESDIGSSPALFGLRPLKGLPFSATEKTTTVQRLADGTTITRDRQRKMARDGEGRTMDQTSNESGSHELKFTNTTVNDPVERTWTHWSTLNKEATVTHLREPGERPVATAASASTSDSVSSTRAEMAGRRAFVREHRPTIETERLGRRNIHGVEAEGLKVTTTYPTDYVGNDRPLVMVRETWTSTELKIVLYTKTEDPRFGVTTTEVTELTRGEPDPTVFRVPEGYRVREQPRPER